MLDHSDDNWPAVRRNVGKARQVLIRLGKILRLEGGYLQVSEMFYWVVLQAVLLFGEETYFLLAAMSRNLEVVHVGFLRNMTGIGTISGGYVRFRPLPMYGVTKT